MRTIIAVIAAALCVGHATSQDFASQKAPSPPPPAAFPTGQAFFPVVPMAAAPSSPPPAALPTGKPGSPMVPMAAAPSPPSPPAFPAGQSVFPIIPMAAPPSAPVFQSLPVTTFQTTTSFQLPGSSPPGFDGPEVIPAPQSQFGVLPSTPAGPASLVNGTTTVESDWSHFLPWKDQNELFHYTWVDFGQDHGLRIHQLEWTNAWADLRAPGFFTRPRDACTVSDFNVGLSFSVQWWKERPRPEPSPFGGSIPPPVLYDLYVDFGWRAQITPGWLLDVALSPGLSTDFRVTPPDGFRMRGHALTIVDMLPNLSGVLGVWYLNRNTTKILPVAGFLWQATANTRIEAVFPRPRLAHAMGCWKGRSWEFSVGGEFGGGGWAFKNPEGARETVDYRDLRLLTGISWSGKRGTGYLEIGYVFNRELQYGIHADFDYDPGNAFLARLGWTY